MAKNDNLGQEDGEKSCVKALGFNGNVRDANAIVADVKNGRLTRIRPLHYDWQYRPEEFMPWKIEARGQALGPENRGKSGYVRISWDEALEIIVSEIRRVNAKYGPYAVLSQSDGHGETKVVHGCHGCNRRLLSLLGGYTAQCRNPDSWEGWYWGAKHVWGMEPVGQQRQQTNLMSDIAENTGLILFWGCDPETTPWGWHGQMSSRFCYWFTELGIKSIYVCPDLNYGASVHADKWIPIRPNTDAALQLAIAHTWIIEGTYDKEYVANHTFGFEKFEDYVLGKDDGAAKTPGWAAGITGIPVRTIKALAREWASRRTTVAIGNGGSVIRGPYSTEPARLAVFLLAMQGLGKPGCNQVKMQEWGLWCDMQDYPMPRPMVYPMMLSAHRGAWAASDSRGIGALPKQIIPKNLIHEAILNPPISWYGTTIAREPLEDQFKKYTYPVEGCSEVHMIWSDSPSWITCWNGANSYIRALRSEKIEFILVQHPWLENDCLFADIILPVNTKLEEDDIGADVFSGQFNVIMHERKCIESVGESKSDYEIVCLIAEKMGLLEEYIEGKSIEEWIETGFENSGVQDMITFDELKEKGYFVIPTDPEWKKYHPGLLDFYKEPEKNPLKTPSGKIEFYSQNLARYFPDDEERPPVPHWIEKGESHDEALSSLRARKYPLLIVSNHPRWRVHSQHDDMTWLREIPTCKVKGPDGYNYEPIWINPLDAAGRRIESGDVVKLYNERGAVLGGARVTERVMPGVVYMDHGAWYDPIIPGELDRGGAINTITPRKITSRNATGMATSGYLVEVEGVNLGELIKRYPEAFKRPYHPAAGLRMQRVLAGKKGE